MSILYRTLSQIVPDGLEKREALTREAGYTTGSFLTCGYCIELCRKFRQMAWKSSKALSLRLSAALTRVGGLSHRHL